MTKDEAQPEQEPVVVVAVNKSGAIRMEYPDGSAFDISKHIGQRFYTTPPQRPWVGLTEEEVDQFHNWKDCTWSTNELVRHVEATLRIKNT
jgi:hypothetical protein